MAATAKIVGLDGRPLARYDGATVTRRTAGWETRSSGPNREIETSLAKLRDRHRDLARNNPWARRAIQAIVNNAIGAGIQAQWSDPTRQSLWSDWYESTAVDADGRLDGYGLQALIQRAIVESGEVLVRRRPRRPEDGLAVPLQIQVLESDYLDHLKTELLPTGGWITQGVEFNAYGRRVAYWLYPEHPGDPLGRRSLTSVRYDAADFLHIYRLDRPGQVRGVPWGTGALLRLRMLDDYHDAQLEKQRLAACYVTFVTEPDAPPNTDNEYELLDKLEPGAVEILPPGKDVKFATPPVTDGFNEFSVSILRSIAADYGLPFEILSGDLSEVNFSSARMGFNEFGRNIDVWRWHIMIPQLLNPLAQWFNQAAALVGLPPSEQSPLWTPPARTLVDQVREMPAMRDAVRAGLMSLPEAIRSMGYDPVTLANEHAQYLTLLDQLGLKLDSDPRADKGRAAANSPQVAP